MGERGLLWYDETGDLISDPAVPVLPERIRDTSGAGDVFHGAYVYSYLTDPSKSWSEHFRFAAYAAAFKIQRLGNQAGLPSRDDIAAVERESGIDAAKRPPARRRA